MPSTTDALFAAVYANPFADAPRAVLADHLMEAGDPRGEFIALQLQKPKGTLRRERQLLEAHESDWLGPLAHVVLPMSNEWERGFLSATHARLHGETVGDPRWATVTRLEMIAADHARPFELTCGTMTHLMELTGASPLCLDLLLKGKPAKQQRALKGFADPTTGFHWPPLEHLGLRLERTVHGIAKRHVDALLRAASFPQLRSLALDITPYWNALEIEWLWKSRLARRLQNLTLRGAPPLDVAGTLARAQALSALHTLTLEHRTARFRFRRSNSGALDALEIFAHGAQPTIDSTILQPLSALPAMSIASFEIKAGDGVRIRKLGLLRAKVAKFSRLPPTDG